MQLHLGRDVKITYGSLGRDECFAQAMWLLFEHFGQDP